MIKGENDLLFDDFEDDNGNNEEAVNPSDAKAKVRRIQKRRQRIQEKIENKNSENTPLKRAFSSTSSLHLLNKDELEEEDEGASKALVVLDRNERESINNEKLARIEKATKDQVEESRKILEQLILDGETLITNVKVAAESREKMRREREKQGFKDRIELLHKESVECKEIFGKINENWLIDAEKLLPIELFDQIKKQQESCNKLLEKKDDLVGSLRNDIDDNDLEYENYLEMYQKDIVLMGNRIDDNMENLRKSFTEELALIENYTLQERDNLLLENRREFEYLLEHFQNMEKNLGNERRVETLTKFDALTEIHGRVKQETGEIKNKMIDDLDVLQQELEQIKNATHLNLEKLDYNNQVLRRREEENSNMKNSMKRLLMRLKDRFNAKALEMQERVRDGKIESEKIIKEIQRLEFLCGVGKKKMYQLANVDYLQYMDLWQVNEELLQEKLVKLYETEKKIYEENLGIIYNPIELDTLFSKRPKEVQDFLDKKEIEAENKKLLRIGSSNKIFMGGSGITSRNEESPVSINSIKNGEVDPNSNLNAESSNTVKDLQIKNTTMIDEDDSDWKIEKRLMTHILRLVHAETGFLLEEKLRKIIAPMVTAEKNLVHIEAVIQALGLENKEDMYVMARYILKHCQIMRGVIPKLDLDISELNAEDQDKIKSPEEEDKAEKPPSLENNKEIGIVSLLNEFDSDSELRNELEKCQNEKEEKAGDLSLQTNANIENDECDEYLYIEPTDVLIALAKFCRDFYARSKIEIATADEILERKLTGLKYPENESVSEYWESFLKILDDKGDSFWENISFAFKDYEKAVTSRNHYLEEFMKVYRENYEFSHLLKKYLQEAAARDRGIEGLNLPFCRY